MFVWDGSDRNKGDEQAAREDALRRQLIMRNSDIQAHMRDYVVAIGIALTGVDPEARSSAAPLITGGFTPGDEGRAAMCIVAELNRRSIVHVNFRTIPPYWPTGIIITIYFDGRKAHPHSRTWMLAKEGDEHVHFMWCTDENDDNYHLVMEPAGRMTRHAHISRNFTDANLVSAATMIEDLIRSGAVGDTCRQLLVT